MLHVMVMVVVAVLMDFIIICNAVLARQSPGLAGPPSGKARLREPRRFPRRP
jgi:hypothetical protein